MFLVKQRVEKKILDSLGDIWAKISNLFVLSFKKEKLYLSLVIHLVSIVYTSKFTFLTIILVVFNFPCKKNKFSSPI